MNEIIDFLFSNRYRVFSGLRALFLPFGRNATTPCETPFAGRKAESTSKKTEFIKISTRIGQKQRAGHSKSKLYPIMFIANHVSRFSSPARIPIEASGHASRFTLFEFEFERSENPDRSVGTPLSIHPSPKTPNPATSKCYSKSALISVASFGLILPASSNAS